MTISVVIPTLGRPTLANTLKSCIGADQIVLVADTSRGPLDITYETLSAAGNTPLLYLEGNFGVTGGHAGRAYGMAHAVCTHLALMDDDDVYTPSAFDVMRDVACDLPVLFRMEHYQHGILWRDPVVRFGNVSTQMVLVPNDPERFGEWTPYAPDLPQPGGDYSFIRGTVERMGGVVWREEIVSVLRPDVYSPLLGGEALPDTTPAQVGVSRSGVAA